MNETLQTILNKPIQSSIIKNYKTRQNAYLMTTRFSDISFEENKRFRNDKNIKKLNVQCIYCSPQKITRVPPGKIMYVLEMNNTSDTIMGIGKLYNRSKLNEAVVYNEYGKESGYRMNRYNYIGEQRIDRSEMNPEELTILGILEIICFKGKGHQKRSLSITQFPIEKLYKLDEEYSIMQIIESQFDRKYPEIK
jgi:hypothetical protein